MKQDIDTYRKYRQTNRQTDKQTNTYKLFDTPIPHTHHQVPL